MWFERFEDPVEIGKGGAATVFSARDIRSGRRVALKRFREDSGFQPARIRREIEAVKHLDHPGVVKILDVIDYEPPEMCLVLELVSGGDLQRRLDQQGALSFDQALELGRALAEILAHAHERGVIHRDLKPSNVLLDEKGAPRLTDFGLARTPSLSSLTSHGQILGTYDFLAPEQRTTATVTERADVFAYGKTLYCAFTGLPPHTIREGRIPERARPVILRCLEEDPGQRYGSMREVLSALDGLATARTPAFELVALDKQEQPLARFALREGSNLIGVLAEGVTPEVDVTALDKHQIVSREHARLDVQGQSLTLSHLSRTNQTHRNGLIVRSGTQVSLSEGDRIVLATNIVLVLRRTP